MIAAADIAPTVTAAPTEPDLTELLAAVAHIDGHASAAVLIDRITALERLKAGCAAAQARLTATFADSVTTDAAARQHRPDATRRSIAGQIALARRDSPHAGRRHVGVAAALVTDLPHTLAALSRGELSERRARTIVEQWACLTSAHRRAADRLLAPELTGLGDRSAETRAAAIACRLDPEAVLAKIRGTVKDRHVGLRPAPDTMARLSALLPVTMGVAVYAALSAAADAATAAPGGDPRSRGQLMADALVSAVTGQQLTGCDDYGVPRYHTAAGGAGSDTNASSNNDAAHQDTAVTLRSCTGGCAGPGGITINLSMTDRALLDGDDEPAHLTGFGPIPAALARALVIRAADTDTRTFIRRLYTDPVSGHLDRMDSTRRLFPPAAQRFLLARDQTCRTPWCDAPIREFDHLQPHACGGATTITNAQGVCQACNLTKQAPGWTARPDWNTIHLTVPTGHHYSSNPPPPPRSNDWADTSSIELRLVSYPPWSA